VNFNNILEGAYQIKASKNGFDSNTISSIINKEQTTTATIKLKRQMCSLKIIVKDKDGNPISGVSITSTSKPSGQQTLSGSSGTDGSLLFSNVELGSYTFQTSKSEYVTNSGTVSAKAGEIVELTISLDKEAKKGCIIATATYGSELSPEVQFLRGFRDNTVLNTFAGRNFMTIFNTWYYSFSPRVASIITVNEAIRVFMKIFLYPLIGILHLAATTCSIFSFNPELAVVVSGLVASSLIGIMFFAPAAIIFLIKRLKIINKLLRVQSWVWVVSVGCITIAETYQWSGLMICSTALFVLSTTSLGMLFSVRCVKRLLYTSGAHEAQSIEST
jgi:hypothetical protein